MCSVGTSRESTFALLWVILVNDFWLIDWPGSGTRDMKSNRKLLIVKFGKTSSTKKKKYKYLSFLSLRGLLGNARLLNLEE